MVEDYHSLTLKQELNGERFLSFASLAYDFACAIELHAKNRLNFALDLLKIITQTHDWMKSKVTSPYIFLAMSKVCDLLMVGDFGSTAQKRNIVKQQLLNPMSLLLESDFFEPRFLKRILSILCGFYGLSDGGAKNPLESIGTGAGEGKSNYPAQLIEIFIKLLNMVRKYSKQFADLPVAGQAHYIKSIKRKASQNCIQVLLQACSRSKGKRASIELDASGIQKMTQDVVDLNSKDSNPKVIAQSKLASDPKVIEPDKKTDLPPGLKIVAGNLKNIDKELIVLKREFKEEASLLMQSMKREDGSLASWQQKKYEKHWRMQVTHIAFLDFEDYGGLVDDITGEKSPSLEFRTVLFLLGNPSYLGRKTSVHILANSFRFEHYLELVSFASKYQMFWFPGRQNRFETRVSDILNKDLAPDIVASSNSQPLEYYSVQIGRMPKALCKLFFDFLVTRGVMPQTYCDFLMQFATAHERFYSEISASQINAFLLGKHYTKAIQEAAVATEAALNKVILGLAYLRPSKNQKFYLDSSLAFELAESLENISQTAALEALCIIIKLAEKNTDSPFMGLVLDKFCRISLSLYREGGREDISLLEQAIECGLYRILYLANQEAMFDFIALLEEYAGFSIVERESINALIVDPEYIANPAEILAYVMGSLSDIVYYAKDAVESVAPKPSLVFSLEAERLQSTSDTDKSKKKERQLGHKGQQQTIASRQQHQTASGSQRKPGSRQQHHDRKFR